MKTIKPVDRPKQPDGTGIFPFVGVWPKSLLLAAYLVGEAARHLRAANAWLRLTAFRAAAERPAAGSGTAFAATMLGLAVAFLAAQAWAQPNNNVMQNVETEVGTVACSVIGMVQGVVGKMLAFAFLAGGAVAAFAGKWGYVAGGMGGGLLLMIGPTILEGAFTEGLQCP